MPAPDVEARLTDEELADLRRILDLWVKGDPGTMLQHTSVRLLAALNTLTHELDAVRRELDGLREACTELGGSVEQLDANVEHYRRQLAAAQKEIAELRGERDAAKARILDLKLTLKGIEKTLPELQAKVLEDCQVEIAALKQEAERRGFAQCREMAKAECDEQAARRRFGVHGLEPVRWAKERISKLQPPPEGTPAAPPVSEPVRYVRPEFHIEPDETSDFGATPEDGYRAGFREGAARAAVSEYERGLESAIKAMRGELLPHQVPPYYVDCAEQAIRSLKGKPADWDPFTTHVEGDFNGPHGPAGGEGGA